jgi:hypothetical protein
LSIRRWRTCRPVWPAVDRTPLSSKAKACPLEGAPDRQLRPEQLLGVCVHQFMLDHGSNMSNSPHDVGAQSVRDVSGLADADPGCQTTPLHPAPQHDRERAGERRWVG